MSVGTGGNTLILGFKNFHDLAITTFGAIKSPVVTMSLISIATINTFITNYIYDSYQAVYFMLFLLVCDSITGIWKAIVNKTFSSGRLPRIAVLAVLYVLMLGISWNAAKFSVIFTFLPSFIFSIQIATLILSLFENLSELGVINKVLFESIKQKLLASSSMISKKDEPKKKDKKKKS